MRKHAVGAAVLAGLLYAAALIPVAGCGGEERSASRPGIPWGNDVEAAVAKAGGSGGIVMIDFTAEWCPPCRSMEDSTFSNPDVISKAGAFIPVRIDVDEQREVAVKYGGNARKYGGIGIPNILFLDGKGRKLKHVVGYHGPGRFIAVMDSVLAAAKRPDWKDKTPGVQGANAPARVHRLLCRSSASPAESSSPRP